MISNKNFAYLWISQILSQVTVQLMNFLLLARLYTVTGSTIATSLLWVAFALPAIFVGPIGAAVVDLVSRRKTLIITNLLQALTVFIYYFTHDESIFLLFFIVLLYSLLNQFYVPAENAILPSLVSKKKLTKANSLFFLTQQASLIVGFGFAGVLQKWLGFSGSLLLCSILLLISFASVYLLPEVRIKSAIPKTFEKAIAAFFETLIEGYKFIKSKKLILFPLILLLAIQTGLAIIVANLPAIASEIFKVSLSYIGLIIVIPVALGSMMGSIFISKKLGKDYRKKSVIEIGLILLASSILLLISGFTSIATVFIFLIGIGFVFVNIPTITFLQEMTPPNLRGRVFGNMWFLVTLCTVFPVLFSGVITELLGVKIVFILMAMGCLYAFYYLKSYGQKILTDNWT